MCAMSISANKHKKEALSGMYHFFYYLSNTEIIHGHLQIDFVIRYHKSLGMSRTGGEGRTAIAYEKEKTFSRY